MPASPNPCCPSVGTSVVLGPCDGSSRLVTFQTVIIVKAQPCPPIIVRWNWGDGTKSPDVTYNPSQSDVTVLHEEKKSFTCGQVVSSASLEVLFSSGAVCPVSVPPFWLPCCGCCYTMDIKAEYAGCKNGLQQVTLHWDLQRPTDPGCANYVMSGTLSLHEFLGPPVAGGSVPTSSFGLLNGTLYPSLAPGLYYAEWVESNVDCKPIIYFFLVPPCDCCPSLNITPDFGICDANGKRPVKVQWTITPPSLPSCPLIDGTLNICGQTVSIVSGLPLAGSVNVGPLAPGTCDASLVLTSPAGCPRIDLTIQVPTCDCCPTVVITTGPTGPNAPRCNPDHLTKHITINAVVTPKPGCDPITAVMAVDGTEVAAATQTGSAPFTLSAEGDYGCGSHDVTVSYPGTTCPDSGDSFCVSACETGECHFIRLMFEIAATTAVVCWILSIFTWFGAVNPTVKVNLFILTMWPSFAVDTPMIWPILRNLAILATVTAILLHSKPCTKTCTKCRHLLVLWEIALAAFVLFLLHSKLPYVVAWAYLSSVLLPVIAVVILVLVTLIVVFLVFLLFKLWVARCCPTECERWWSVFDSIVVVVTLSLLSMRSFIPSVYITTYYEYVINVPFLGAINMSNVIFGAIVIWVLRKWLPCT
jgi:hypothetical protein